VFGWTIGNDVSERTWQANDRTLWRAKNCDTFKPMGPWIVTDAGSRRDGDHDPPQRPCTETFKTNNMIFDAPTYISRGQQVLHHRAGRRDVDGHRRRAAEHDGRRCVRDREFRELERCAIRSSPE
jgi:hypothetical protein